MLPTISVDFYFAALPILILCAGSVLSMLQAVIPSMKKTSVIEVSYYFILVGAIVTMPSFWNLSGSFLSGTFVADDLLGFSRVVILLSAFLVSILISASYLREYFFRAEITCLFMMVLAGFLILIGSYDLISIFIGLELSSIGLYGLVGYINPSRKSREGAVKYLILGSVSAAFLLFGFALAYAATGSMMIPDIFSTSLTSRNETILGLGGIFVLIGLGFKFGLVPFHLWAPDAYESAPTAITAFMATIAKSAILLLLIRFILANQSIAIEVWRPGLSLLAMLTIIIGNLMALAQSNLKRMLAYSSIAHSGYLAIGLAALGGSNDLFTLKAIFFYIIFYTVMTLGMFAILIWLESEKKLELHIADIQGLSKSHPLAAFGIAVFMFSFAGLPPTVGFMGKLFLFKAALNEGLVMLAVVGVLGSTISLYYYLRLVVFMYMKEPGQSTVSQSNKAYTVGFIAAAMVILSLIFGTLTPGIGLEHMTEYAGSIVNTKKF